MAQMGFFDLSDRYASLDAKNDPLVESGGPTFSTSLQPLFQCFNRLSTNQMFVDDPVHIAKLHFAVHHAFWVRTDEFDWMVSV